MDYRLGIDIGSHRTAWVAHPGGTTSPAKVIEGGLDTVVALTIDGRLVAGAEVRSLAPGTIRQVATGFVEHLGEPAPIIIGGTPYGAEALTAGVVAAAMSEARGAMRAEPGAVVIVHDDGLDPYRAGQLTEAARLAGIPPSSIFLAARSHALSTGGSGAAGGAAQLGWILVPPTEEERSRAAAAVAGAAGGAAAVIGAEALTGTATAASMAAVAGPAGAPLTPLAGPAGAPLTPPAGPAGAPLTPPAGPTGAPLTPPTGPGGTPLSPLRPRKFWAKPAVIATASAIVVVGAVAAIVVNAKDDPAPTTTVAVADTTSSRAPTADVAGLPTTTGGPAATGDVIDEIDVSSILGTWQDECDPYIALDGASRGGWTFERTGPNQVLMTAFGYEFNTADCSDEPMNPMSWPFTFEVTGTTTIDGLPAFTVLDQRGMKGVIGINAAGMLMMGSADRVPVDANGYPTAYDPNQPPATRAAST